MESNTGNPNKYRKLKICFEIIYLHSMKISILMPVKNAAEWLTECLDSMVGQSEEDWELLAVDDHSDDDSLLILLAYERADPRIKIRQNRGAGIIEALRMALELSSGELIHRMDADDIMPQNKLETLKKAWLNSGKGHVITGKVRYFSGTELSEGYLEYQNWLNALVDNNNHWQNIYRECVIASPAWMLHREDLKKCGAFAPDRYPEDYDLVFRMYEAGLTLVALDEIIHLWREHPKRSSRNSANYNQEAFFRLRIHYFLKLHHDSQRKLLLLGAGIKGKLINTILGEQGIKHTWIGRNERDKHMNIRAYGIDETSQVIVSFSDPGSQLRLQTYLISMGMKENLDYFFFR